MTKRAQLGMTMFLISEAVFFFLLILAVTYFRAVPALDPLPGWLLTALLLASAISLWRESRWLAIVLGAAFLIAEVMLSLSFLTAIHGFHIFAGLIALAVVPSPALRVVALYWYFLWAVWLVIFLVAYFRSAA
jgi:heme/copper-type cytochrome/quinol oxidase subunit 3